MPVHSRSVPPLAASQPQPVLPAPALGPAASGITWRSVLIGLAGVIVICGLSPYNDHVVSNSYFIGGTLPIGLLLFYLVLILLVNAPLSRWWPRLAFSRQELAVALGMTLVSCAIPAVGLMNYLPSSLVGIIHYGGANSAYGRLLADADLPAWLFPAVGGSDARQHAIDPVITEFRVRSSSAGEGFVAQWLAVPWAKWVAPAIAWGTLLALLYGALLCFAVLVRRQWAENERLPFPLATVYTSLIEAPAPGQALNPLLQSPGFWIAGGSVFLLHSLNALHSYFPAQVPAVPLAFDLRDMLNTPIWNATSDMFRASYVYFAVIGATYFLQSKIAFSLWIFYVAYQVAVMLFAQHGASITLPMRQDQMFGALLVFAGTIAWIGRREWAMILRHMFGRPADRVSGRYMPYAAAGWGFVVCLAGMVGWLVVAGCSPAGAIITVGMSMLLLVVVARVAAETGLLFIQLNIPVYRPWVYLAMLPQPVRTTSQSFLFGAWFNALFTHDTREPFSVYATHAYRTADMAGAEQIDRSRGHGFVFTLLLALAVAVGLVVSSTSMLYIEYAHATPFDTTRSQVVNEYGVDYVPNNLILRTSEQYATSRLPQESHRQAVHFGIGAGTTAVLSFMSLRFANWPLHPLGFVLAFTFPISRMWFSLMLGWLAKVLLLKYGGARIYQGARPVFIGLIVGEAGTAGLWLVVSLICSLVDLPYRAVYLTP